MAESASRQQVDDMADVSHLYRFDRPAEGVDSWSEVSTDAIEFFHSQGYFVVRHGLDSDEVNAGLEGLLDLIGGSRPDFHGLQFEAWATDQVQHMDRYEKQDYVRKLQGFVSYDDRLLALSKHPQILKFIENIFREEPQLFQDMALLKPPGGGREKPWHQDKAYFDLPVDTPVVGVWIALDEVGAENGCMHVIPGTHRKGPVIHFKRRDWQICDTDVDVQADVYVPLPPGGCLFFDGMIHHGTAPNESNRRRRALQFHYAPKSAVKTSTDERLSVWGSEGKDVDC